MPFALWTRPAIRALIRDHFGVDLQERLIGKYLKRWGFTPQRPVKSASAPNAAKGRQLFSTPCRSLRHVGIFISIFLVSMNKKGGDSQPCSRRKKRWQKRSPARWMSPSTLLDDCVT
ncbi:helix-turn-helix domain-containing protein [Acidithiobacillus ferrooxidans]|uniref:helix-turn-helix domain-containing protein n=1 Tax=Acidithiobacillus ferrooxidans TaxID=920 RepID=UPI0035A6363D